MLFIILFITIVLCIAVFYFKSNRNYWRKQNVVQVGDLMINFIFGKQSIPEIVKKIYNEYDEPYVGMTQATIPTLMLKSPEDIKAVLAGDFQSFHSRGIIANPNDLLADNLLFINDFQRWKIIRQKLSPVFTSAKLKSMFYILEKCSRDFVEYLEGNLHTGQKPFNALYTYTTSSIGAAVFGIDTQTNKSTMESPFLEMAWKTLEPSLKQNIIITMANVCPSVYKMLQLKIFGEYEDFFVGAVKKVLANRRNETTKRHDFIDICLDLQKQGAMQDPNTGYELEPTDEVLAAQAFFFFIAGADTSASTMNYTLLELSNNPKILTKLHEEIDKVFEGGAKEMTYNDIEKMQYLDKVLNEAMRKYPPIGVIQRLCSKDTYLPSGVKIAKDNITLIPVFALHRDEKYYPNPDVFDPERFSSENGSNVNNNYVYLPFGEGNRICIGNRFARLQVKVGLASLLRRFTLVESKNVTPTFEPSPFGLRSPDVSYEWKLRDI
ncbi:hypothetical protein PYW08_014366 [Mythimna loreyi]|uniref:Uncharacterized protein n=1 Tax=Mythimna loreyi TaxID=667449 RepID=A0ACC2R7K8_9NEOP|nr:hypothetical protein PYW08_014366 [Mythimna loreyi]